MLSNEQWNDSIHTNSTDFKSTQTSTENFNKNTNFNRFHAANTCVDEHGKTLIVKIGAYPKTFLSYSKWFSYNKSLKVVEQWNFDKSLRVRVMKVKLNFLHDFNCCYAARFREYIKTNFGTLQRYTVKLKILSHSQILKILEKRKSPISY